jgi:hypothetical protein
MRMKRMWMQEDSRRRHTQYTKRQKTFTLRDGYPETQTNGNVNEQTELTHIDLSNRERL